RRAVSVAGPLALAHEPHQVTIRLDNQADSLSAVGVQSEGGAGVRADKVYRALDSGLDVLRIEVAPVVDDEVLETAGDIEFAVAQTTEIARAEEWPLVRIAQKGLERFSGLFRAVPVGAGDALTGDPDLADPSRR